MVEVVVDVFYCGWWAEYPGTRAAFRPGRSACPRAIAIGAHSDPLGVRRLITVEDRSRELAVAGDWQRVVARVLRRTVSRLTALPEIHPAMSLVFVQSRDGNTGARQSR